MSAERQTKAALLAENEELRARLAEAEETLRAIREGEVDAVIVSGSQGDRVFALSEADNLHRQMVETMNEGGLATTPAGLLMFCNDRACVLLGRSRAQLVGHDLGEFVAPEDLPRYQQLLQTAPGAKADARIEFRLPGGRAMPVHLWVSVLERAGEPLVCFVATDVTRLEEDRRLIDRLIKQEQELREGRKAALHLMEEARDAQQLAEQSAAEVRQQAQLLAQVHDAIITTDLAGNITYWNEGAERLYGYSVAEALGRHVGMLYLEEERGRMQAEVLGPLLAQGQHELEMCAPTKSGAVVWVHRSLSLLRDAAGAPQGMIGYSLDITARVAAEAAARENEQQFRLLIQNLQSAVALVNEQGAFTIVNRSFLRLFELADEATIKNVNDRDWSQWRVFDEHGALLDVDEHPVRKAALTGQPVRSVLVAVQAPTNTALKWILVSAEPILDAQGRVHRLICSYHDITELKQAELALQQSEQRFRLALRNAPVSVAVQDRDLRYIWAYNQRTATPEEIIGKRDDEIFTAEEAAHVTAIKRRVLAENIELREQMWFDRPGGRLFLDIYFEPMHDAAGRVIGVGSTTVNLTPVKLAEDALQKLNAELEDRVRQRTAEVQETAAALRLERQRFQDVLEMLPAYVVLLAPDYHVPFANQYFETRFGKANGRRCYEYLFNRTTPCENCESFKPFTTHAVHRWEWTGPDQRIYAIHDYPFADTDGSPLVLEMGVDITEMRQAQAALRATNETLEQRVVQRTSELAAANEELLRSRSAVLNLMDDAIAAGRATEQANAALQASVHEKDALLKEVHHRVKNNLQVISSLVSLQAESLTDERQRRVFCDVRDRVRSMALVHEKLYQTADLAHINFADYAESLLQALWRAHGPAAGRVRYQLDCAPLTLPIESAVPCGLILNELASNALKHAFPAERGGTLAIAIAAPDAAGTVTMRVSDDGVGLPAAHDWRQSKSLGLRLVQILAGQLHGTLEAGPGPGATFTLVFGRKEAGDGA